MYYSSLYFTTVDELPQMSILNLVAEIGGLLGLFIGASFLSIAEFFGDLIRLILSVYNNRQNKTAPISKVYNPD